MRSALEAVVVREGVFHKNAREKGVNIFSNSKLNQVHDLHIASQLAGAYMMEKNRFRTRIVDVILLAQQFPNY